MSEDIIISEGATSPRRDHPLRILILGGTSEASLLAASLASWPDVLAISSLAGRVENPRLPPGIVRVGGFGGAAGLASYLINENIDVVIDATHPFAAKISGNAESACKDANVPLIALERPRWEPLDEDRWIHVRDAEAAALLVNLRDNRVFLSIGRQELGAFSECSEAWFLVRGIDEPTERLPLHSKLILKRGPFSLRDELQLLRDEGISVIVSKNSGGAATYSKIEAARELRIAVVMIDRPWKHKITTVATSDDVLQRLAEFL
jgi:precorrin-6A/cobalt-precorrin-6A reductase